MTTGPQDPAAAGRGRLRAGHADREQVIEALKDAFVQGRLTRDELDARAGRALSARTCADLAALTADIPSRPVGLGTALGELSRGTGRRSGEPMPLPRTSPLEESPHEYGRVLPAARPDEAYLTTLRTWRRSPTA